MTVVMLPLPIHTCTGDEVSHLWCCDENLALCGADITDEPTCLPGCACKICPLCVSIDRYPCEECGAQGNLN